MNIFKVLASGKKSFQEETASAILIWFMHPSMEHGLGYSFLSKFIKELSIKSDNAELRYLSEKLKLRLRGEYENQRIPWFNLEYSVDGALIDIIIGIEDWTFIIENKIYSSSVTKGQLGREYEGIKKRNSDAKIGMVYLIPIEEDSPLDGKTEKEFEELIVRDFDFKVLATWQKNNIKAPSISKILSEILDEESRGELEPVSEYTRHTLKALISFVSNNFDGYDYERDTLSSGVNPLTEDRLKLDDLMKTSSGYVGVKGGMRGLLKMEQEIIKSHRFQYTSQDMSLKPNWLGADTFQKIISWVLYEKVEDVPWKGRFPSKQLYMIAKDFGPKVFIGIRGGENALRSMDGDEIKNRDWNISTEEKASPQWITGELFYKIISEKNVF